MNLKLNTLIAAFGAATLLVPATNFARHVYNARVACAVRANARWRRRTGARRMRTVERADLRADSISHVASPKHRRPIMELLTPDIQARLLENGRKQAPV